MTELNPPYSVHTLIMEVHGHDGCDDAEVATTHDGQVCVRLTRGRQVVDVTVRDGAWWVQRTSGTASALRDLGGQPLSASADPGPVAAAIVGVLWDLERGYLQTVVDQVRMRHGLHAAIEDEGNGPYIMLDDPQQQQECYTVTAVGMGWHAMPPDDSPERDVGILEVDGEVLTTRANPEQVADALGHLLVLHATAGRLRAGGLHAFVDDAEGTLVLSVGRSVKVLAEGQGWLVTDGDVTNVRALQPSGAPGALTTRANPEQVADAIGHILGMAVTPAQQQP